MSQNQYIHPTTIITFIKEGEKVRLSNIKGAACILKPGVGWQVDAGLDRALRFPSHIAVIQQRPDLIIWSDVIKRVIIVELTVRWEGNTECAYERKLCWYEEER